MEKSYCLNATDDVIDCPWLTMSLTVQTKLLVVLLLQNVVIVCVLIVC